MAIIRKAKSLIFESQEYKRPETVDELYDQTDSSKWPKSVLTMDQYVYNILTIYFFKLTFTLVALDCLKIFARTIF